ncbi:MAG: OmpA family protein [Bacteroidetes bacterium]|nr:OmpA family protein [Bacteroidota bacterium]MDA0860244.1 OmpA family protein [Bacteroidota bacterium]MDA1318452.1 OmpA family protein [Bacteroidota bacterium]
MSKKTIYLLGILATLIIGFFLHWHFCCNEDCTKNAIVDETSQGNASAPLTFKFEDGDITIRSNDNFNFMSSNHAIVQPLSEDLLSCVKEMITHLSKNKDKSINITGFFKEEENNPSNFENLGIARAKAIERFLIEHELSANQISTFGEKDNTLVPDQNDILYGPYEFSVKNLNDKSKQKNAMKESIMKDPVLIQFSKTKSYAVLNTKQKNKRKALANYLNSSDDASCTIVGHTDSAWSDESNMRLGKKRAEFTKRKLLEYNVDRAKIKTISKGETAPIATNKTENGKAQNRRTEVIIN